MFAINRRQRHKTKADMYQLVVAVAKVAENPEELRSNRREIGTGRDGGTAEPGKVVSW